jgi:hypothetical protein
LATLWWSKGLFWLSRRFFAERRFGMAPFALGLACLAFWFIASKVLVFTALTTLEYYQAQTERAACAAGQVRFPQPAKIVVVADGGRLLLIGPLGRGSAATLAQVLGMYPTIKLLELNSPGGYVDEAGTMRRLIEREGVNTLVVERCASACTDVFLGGNRRYIVATANFGFHQSGHCALDRGDLTWGAREYENAGLYRRKQIQRSFALAALGTSYFSLWQPSADDVKDSGFATEWWPLNEAAVLLETR